MSVLSSYTLDTEYSKRRIGDLIKEREILLEGSSKVARFHNHVTERAKELGEDISDKEILRLFKETNKVHRVYGVKALNKGTFILLSIWKRTRQNKIDNNKILRTTYAICNLYGDLQRKPEYIDIYCRFGKLTKIDRSR